MFDGNAQIFAVRRFGYICQAQVEERCLLPALIGHKRPGQDSEAPATVAKVPSSKKTAKAPSKRKEVKALSLRKEPSKKR